VNLNNGSASLTISTLTAGSHSLTAVYGGSATFATSTSPVVTQIVNAPVAAATSTSLTSTPNPSTAGQPVTLSSTVTSTAGVPTGTVTFRDGNVSLGVVTLNNGSASLTISTLAPGSHSLTAVYSGSATFAASTSPVVIQIVNAANAAADTVTINRAEFRAGTGELRVEGVNSRIGSGNFASSVEIHNGAAAGGTCSGALIATSAVNGVDGSWRFRGNVNLTVTTVCVKSAGGGVASRTVTQK